MRQSDFSGMWVSGIWWHGLAMRSSPFTAKRRFWTAQWVCRLYLYLFCERILHLTKEVFLLKGKSSFAMFKHIYQRNGNYFIIANLAIVCPNLIVGIPLGDTKRIFLSSLVISLFSFVVFTHLACFPYSFHFYVSFNMISFLHFPFYITWGI